MKKKVSIIDVSKLSGVSVATVSRVIHQNGRFSQETEKSVREAIKKLNYIPDFLAQSMRTRTMPILGVIVPDIMDENYALMVRILQEKLYPLGYSIEIFNSNENSELTKQYVQTLHTQHACGIIDVPDNDSIPIEMGDIPVIYFDRRPANVLGTNCIQIEMNNRTAARNAVLHLIENGNEKIALLSDKFGISSQQARIKGYDDALSKAVLERGPVYLVDPQRTSEAVAALQGVFDQKKIPFDGIFCTSVRLTIGVLSVMHKAGLPPDTVKVLGFGEHRIHQYGLLSYSAIREPIQTMAEKASELIIPMIHGEPISSQIVIIPVEKNT